VLLCTFLAMYIDPAVTIESSDSSASESSADLMALYKLVFNFYFNWMQKVYLFS